MKKYVIAIDLGGTNIKAAVVKDCRKILKRVSLPTSDYPTKGALISGMAAMTLDLLKKAGLKKGDVAGIGMGAPGLIDSRNGIIHHLVNIRGFNEVYVASLLKRRTGLDVFLDNDVNVMTLGELYYGAGRGAKNMLCLTLGTGVGGGIVIDGRLYRGSGLAAGEIGHMPLNESGPVCNCGGFGCMEKAVGNKHIVEAALRKIRSGEKSVITGMVKGDFKKVTPEIISRAAKKGDRVAAAV
jgi:glucokinase